nr:metalloregulator ArsR/SmtB family transcription factor [Algiphilus sp.]
MQYDARLDAVFRALADPTRRDMLRRLGDGEQNVGQLAAPCAMSLAAASKHIRVLENAGLVERRVAGRTHWFRLHGDALAEAHAWLARYEGFWTGRLDALARALEAPDTP